MKSRLLILIPVGWFFVNLGWAATPLIIDTATAWNESDRVSAFGEIHTATMGQTITAVGNGKLESFTFYLDDNLNDDFVDFQAVVYKWNGTSIIGDSLFTSNAYTTTNNGGVGDWEELTVNTNGVTLVDGLQYALLFTASFLFDGIEGDAGFGLRYTDVYEGGQFVFLNNKDVFYTPLNLITRFDTYDAAFRAVILPIPPALTCIGDSFESPFNEIITLNNKVKRAIPVKMPLVDADGNLITESDISTPPVVNVAYTPGAGADGGTNHALVPPGLADEGNEFRFEYPYWVFNLSTKQFTSAGTYEVIAIAGDDSYVIDASSCSGTFVRLP